MKTNVYSILSRLLICVLAISCKGTSALGSFGATGAKPDVNAPDYWEHAELIWGDEFEGNGLLAKNWKIETGQHGWGNNELQNYVANGNVEVSDGTLKIMAKKVGSGQETGDYTSARLNSTREFRYGRFEIRAKLPEYKGNGLWPAIWMLGNDLSTKGWPQCGEIDIMEYVSYQPNNVHMTIHSKANNHVDGTEATSGPIVLESAEEAFHTYGLLWSGDYLKFYVDDIENIKFVFLRPEEYTSDNWPFSKPFYLLMNIAVGGNWGGQQGVDDSIFPAVMEVDFVRVYQVK